MWECGQGLGPTSVPSLLSLPLIHLHVETRHALDLCHRLISLKRTPSLHLAFLTLAIRSLGHRHDTPHTICLKRVCSTGSTRSPDRRVCVVDLSLDHSIGTQYRCLFTVPSLRMRPAVGIAHILWKEDVTQCFHRSKNPCGSTTLLPFSPDACEHTSEYYLP